MNVDLAKLPDHVAIIMDGNGRWAKKRGLERLAGHRAGSEAVEHIITHTRKLKIPYLTLYAFSHENWERPEDEVEGLMQLLSEFLVSKKQKMLDNGICFKTIGNTNLLPDFVKKNGVVESYRNYYNTVKSSFAKWKFGNIPNWYIK